MSELEEVLNSKYHELKSPLEQKLQAFPDGPAAIDRFFAQCATLRANMVQEYCQMRSAALTRALKQGSDVTSSLLAKADIEELWGNTPLDECEAKLLAFLEHLTVNAISSIKRNCVGRWLLEDSSSQYSDEEVSRLEEQEARFNLELQGVVEDVVDAFRTQWMQELSHRLQADAAHTESEEDEEDEEEDGEEEEEEEETASKAVRGINLSANKKVVGTAAEQRQKAAEWAAKELGLKNGGKVVKKRGKKISPAKKPVKSVEQQRADALAYAKKLYGENIGAVSPSGVKSSARRSSSASFGLPRSNPFAANAATPPLPPPSAAASASARKNTRKRTAVEAVAGEDSEDDDNSDSHDDDYDDGGSATTVQRKGRGVAAAPVAGKKKQARYGSRPTHSSSLPSPPAVAPAEKVDPVKAARMEAQRQAQERAAASASAAADRANKAKAKKK